MTRRGRSLATRNCLHRILRTTNLHGWTNQRFSPKVDSGHVLVHNSRFLGNISLEIGQVLPQPLYDGLVGPSAESFSVNAGIVNHPRKRCPDPTHWPSEVAQIEEVAWVIFRRLKMAQGANHKICCVNTHAHHVRARFGLLARGEHLEICLHIHALPLMKPHRLSSS